MKAQVASQAAILSGFSLIISGPGNVRANGQKPQPTCRSCALRTAERRRSSSLLSRGFPSA